MEKNVFYSTCCLAEYMYMFTFEFLSIAGYIMNTFEVIAPCKARNVWLKINNCSGGTVLLNIKYKYSVVNVMINTHFLWNKMTLLHFFFVNSVCFFNFNHTHIKLRYRLLIFKWQILVFITLIFIDSFKKFKHRYRRFLPILYLYTTCL